MALQVIAGMTALVTGAARGIGHATCAALAAEGVRVLLTDIDETAAENAAEALRGSGAEIKPVALDVCDPAAFTDVIASAERDGHPVDILVNNAGIMPVGPFLDADPHLEAQQLAINLHGVIHGMRAALPGMLRRRRGHIVNIASTAGVAGIPGAAVYSATKHAVVGLTEAVRREHLRTGVHFTYVLPSLVDTELTRGTRPLRYPPLVSPSTVADAVVHALHHRAVDVYVPRFVRLLQVLPAVLPRPLVEDVGRWFGIDRVFDQVDDEARAAYRARMAQSPGA